MTTTYHTPHPFGNDVDSAEFNSRLGQLDAAIGVAVASGFVDAASTLDTSAAAGSRTLSLVSVTGYLVGDSVYVGAAGSGLAESHIVKSVNAGTNDLTIGSANVALATSAAADDIIDTATAHGFAANDIVVFGALTGGTGLSIDTPYYVIAANLASTTFQVSATQGGAAINFTTDITAGSVYKAQLANTHAIGQPVSRSPAEIVSARGTFATLGQRLDLLGRGIVSVKEYGAVGNNIADDTTAIQAAHDAAGVGGAVFYSEGVYKITGPVYFDSRQLVFGVGRTTEIRQATSGAIALASRAYLSTSGVSPTGYSIIRDLYIAGVGGAGSRGIVLHDFYSQIENVEVEAFQDLIHMTHVNSAGTPIGGTLVENQVRGFKGRSYSRYALYLGADDNVKLTDGLVENVIIGEASAGAVVAIYCGSWAGWITRGVHVYNTTVLSGSPLYLYAGFHSVLSDVYLESAYTTQQINLESYQRGCSLSNVTAVMSASGGSAVAVTHSALFPNDGLSISNLVVVQDNAVATTAISAGPAAFEIHATGIHLSGDNAAFITPAGGGGAVGVRIINGEATGCSLFHNATQNVPNSTPTVLTFNSEATDTDGFHSTSVNPHLLIVPVRLGGTYVCGASIRWASNATGWRRIYFRKNGVTNLTPISQNALSGVETDMQITQRLILAGGDYLEVLVDQNSGGALDVIADGGSQAMFWCERVGA